MASRAGVRVPDPIGVDIGGEIAFGSIIYPDLSFDKSQFNRDPEMAARILAFDCLTQNSDRRTDNPNLGVAGHGIVAFDMEWCFLHLSIPAMGRMPAWSAHQ